MTTWSAAVDTAERAQTIRDLQAARTELVLRGRCTHTLIDDGGRVCALGAVGIASVEGFLELDEGHREASLDVVPRAIRAQHALAACLLPLKSAGDRAVVWRFNDAGRTTDRDVLDLFDKALAELGGMA